MNRPWSFKPYTDDQGRRWIDGQGWLITLACLPSALILLGVFS